MRSVVLRLAVLRLAVLRPAVLHVLSAVPRPALGGGLLALAVALAAWAGGAATDRDPSPSPVAEAGPARAPARPVSRVAAAPRPAVPVRPVVHRPVPGVVSSPFGWRRHPVSGRARHHDGVDLAVPLGTPVRAVAAGRVRSVGRRAGYGLAVEIEHASGLGPRPARTLYAHLSSASRSLRPGDRVTAGQVVGASGGRPGRDGVSTGPHLHFEVRTLDGQPLDPARFIPRLLTEGVWYPRAEAPPSAPPPPPDAPVPADTVVVGPVPTAEAPADAPLPPVVLPEYPALVPAASAPNPAG